jgi:tRNA/tmRNA/rRNA uracil-C5-methylase (TrmA/RlmC/RlmD family)
MGAEADSTGMPRRQGDAAEVLDLAVTGVAHGGWCVARDAGGRVVFVRHALPGEQVRARVTDATASFARAEAIEVLRASPDRVPPRCPHARPGGCGGCDWQHADLAAQRRLKAEVVRDQLRRIVGVDRTVTVEPVAGDSGGLGWRTRVRFSVSPGGTAGLLAHRSHDVVEVGDCPIAHPLVRAAEVTARDWAPARSVEVAVSPASGERAVIVTTPQSVAGRQIAADADTVLRAGRGGRLTTLAGRGSLRQHAAGRSWRVSAGAFWQVHPGAADALSAAVLDVLRPRPGEVALDLFCGAGLFAGALAAWVGPDGAVIAVDSGRAAVRDARHNLRDWPWARVHRGDVAQVLRHAALPPARLVVADPPRAGLAKEVVGYLSGAPAAERFAYVSCDPATLARDLGLLLRGGWALEDLRAFDAFPMTHHVECVATLTR